MTKESATALKTIDSPLYGYMKAIIFSFFSQRLYVDVAKRWKGLGLTYFFLVIILFTIPFGIRLVLEFNAYFEEGVINTFKLLPLINIQHGKVISDKPMPYIIKNQQNKTVIIIDTTDKITQMDKKYPDLVFLINKDRVLFRSPPLSTYVNDNKVEANSPISVLPLDPNINEVLEGEEWLKVFKIKHLKIFFQFFLYVMTVSCFFFLPLTILLALALMGQFIAQLFFDLPLKYKQTLRILIISSTPTLFFLLLFISINWIFSGIGLLLLIIFALYFCWALIAIKNDSRKLVIK